MSRIRSCLGVPPCLMLLVVDCTLWADGINGIVEHLEDALAFYGNAPELNDFAALLSEYDQYSPGECTYCNHCLPCPVGIDIGKSIRLGDQAAGGLSSRLVDEYGAMAVPPSECIRCGDCEERCPFEVETMMRLEESAAAYGRASQPGS